jgi:hypothetical protein
VRDMLQGQPHPARPQDAPDQKAPGIRRLRVNLRSDWGNPASRLNLSSGCGNPASRVNLSSGGGKPASRLNLRSDCSKVAEYLFLKQNVVERLVFVIIKIVKVFGSLLSCLLVPMFR